MVMNFDCRSEGQRAHPVLELCEDGSGKHPSGRGGRERDAGKDYPESSPKAAGVRVWGRPAGAGARSAGHRGGDPPPGAPPADVFRVRAAGARLRHLGPAPLCVRAAVGHPGLFPLRDATRAVPHLRRARRGCPLGRGQASPDDDLRLVPGAVGQAPELDGGRRGVPHDVGARLPLGGDGRNVGPGAPRPDGYHGDRDR